MTQISGRELEKIVDGIITDRESIIRHNPVGTPEEILLWMLLSSLVVYLNLSDLETPCFTGRPDASTYREAIQFVLKDRLAEKFAVSDLLDKLSAAACL
jgi:hypothetical protein